MIENDNYNEIEKNKENLLEISNNISKTYSDVADCLEERLYRIKNMLESGVLDENDTDFYANQVLKTQNRIVDCDSLRSEEISKIDKIIVRNEEELKNLKDNDENESRND
jgi:hypothetical protein